MKKFALIFSLFLGMPLIALAQSGAGPSITGAFMSYQPDGNDSTDNGYFETEYTQFTTLMGARPQYYLAYTDNSQGVANEPSNASWTAWSWNLTGASYVGPTSGTIPVIGIPMSDASGQWSTVDTFYQEVISGSLDADYTGIVDGWANEGYTNLEFRPGYEFTGTTQAWSPDNSSSPNAHADFVAAFQRIVNDIRAECTAKGVTCKICWCTAGRQGSSYNIATALYPGNAYVDIISTDIYAGGTPDNLINWGTGGTTSAANQTAWYATPGDADHYYQWVDSGYDNIAMPPLGPYGWSVQNTIDFAKQQGKPMAFDEAGCGDDTSGNDDADFPAWAAAAIAGAQAQGVTVDHVDIWDNGNWQFTGSGNKPNESAAWAQGFGSASGGSLPSGWSNTNITSTFTLSGAAFASNGVYTLRSAGSSITSTADSFDYAAENTTVDPTAIARVTSVISTSGGSKTAVMIRDSTTVGAIYAEADVTPSGGVEFYTRSATNGTPTLSGNVSTGVTPSITTPIWLKLIKSGTSYTAYYSTSVSTPSTWTQIGSAATVTLTQSPYLVGLGVCSYDNGTGTRATATVDNVSVSSSPLQMLGAPIAFTSAAQLGSNFWSGTNGTDVTWNSAGDDVTVADNVIKTAWIYNTGSTGATGNHPGTAGGSTLNTYSSVILQADVSFDYLGNDGSTSDSFGFYTNVNSGSTAGFVVIVCPQNSTQFDVRIGGEANPTVSGGSAASTPPNPSGATFGTGFWLNAPSGANVGQLVTLNSGSTFSTGTFYTVQLIENQNITNDTITYQVNIYNLAGVLMGSFNSGTITGVASAYNQAGQVGVFTYDKSTTGGMAINDFAALTGTVLPFDVVTDLEDNFWCGTNDTDVTWNANGSVNVADNVIKTGWIYNPSVTPGTSGHPATAAGASTSTFTTVTLQTDVSFDYLGSDGGASDSFGYYTNINSGGTAGFVVIVCPQNSTQFDVRIGGEANPIVTGGSSASTPPNPSGATFGTGFWLNAPSGANVGQLVTLNSGSTFSTGTYYTVQLVETQNTSADTINYQVNIFTTTGTLMGSYNSGPITGVAAGYNQAGQVGVFTYDKSTTGGMGIQNLIISP